MKKLILFTSPTCAPCKMLKKVMLALQIVHGFEFEQYDSSVHEHVAMFAKYTVRSAPYFVLLDDEGNVEATHMGYQGEKPLLEMLEEWGIIQ